MTLSNYEFSEIWPALEALVLDPETGDERGYEGYISELLYYMRDNAVITVLDAFKVIDNWRHNDEQGVIIAGVGSGRTFRVQAYYSSYDDGDDNWYSPEIIEVRPVTKTITRYEGTNGVIFEFPSKDA